MNDSDKDLVFSESVKAGKRIYYFDVKQSRNGDRYISITESKKINEGTHDNPRFVYEKHKLFLYKEDYDKFVDALTRTLDVAAGNITARQASEEIASRTNMEQPVRPKTAPMPSAPKQTHPAPTQDVAPEPEKKSLLDKMLDIF